MRVSKVSKLIEAIKLRLDDEELSDKVITLRRGQDEDLNSETPISELYNTNENPLEIVIDGKYYILLKLDYLQQRFLTMITHLPDPTSKDENEPEFQFASAAFSCGFNDNLDYLKYFQNYITSCHNSSKDTYIPYVSIVQSSGYGKSRLIKEYANNVYTLYLNLGIGRNCFPRPSACAKEFINSFKKAKNPDDWFNNFLAKAVSLLDTEIKSKNTDKSSFWENHLRDDGQSIWGPAINTANNVIKNDLMLIRDSPGYLEQNFNDENDIKILLCIDEGRKLIEEMNDDLKISLFRCWRRALRNNKWRARGLFSVILDTTSRISNFSPASGYDPTLKALNQDQMLFKPFIYISTYNSLVDNSDNFYSKAFSMGRPCWKALRDEYIKEVSEGDISAKNYAWEKVKLLVKAKIQGGTNNLVDDEKKNLTSVAVLASFCSVDISPSVHFASNLVASHLGTCLAISQDRTKILVCYPSEPLVTEAAYELLDDNMLLLIAQSFGQGIVEPGKRGEILGELILILTRHKLCKRLIRQKTATFFTGEIKLADFLKELLANNVKVLESDCYEHRFFENANISFTRFVTIRTIPTLDDVKKGYESCVAFNLKRNHKGADFLIPVKCNGQTYTVWIIQIKNHNLLKCDSNVTVDSTSKLWPKYVFSKTDLAELTIPYLAMYWQLGAHHTTAKEVEWGIATRTRSHDVQDVQDVQDEPPSKLFRTHYTILGLKSFKVAREDTLKGLRTILEAYVDPYDKFWSSDKFLNETTTYTESFLPWHPPDSKLDRSVLLDKYDDSNVQNPVQEA